MSLLISTDISCDGDGCSEWTEGTSGMQTDAKAARRNAAKSGWKRVQLDGRMVDLCPDCAAEAESKALTAITGNPFEGAILVDAIEYLRSR